MSAAEIAMERWLPAGGPPASCRLRALRSAGWKLLDTGGPLPRRRRSIASELRRQHIGVAMGTIGGKTVKAVALAALDPSARAYREEWDREVRQPARNEKGEAR